MDNQKNETGTPKHLKKPGWLRVGLPGGKNYLSVREILENHKLHTICSSGNCPNLAECWNAGTATLLILGDICTRSCRFCATKTGKPLPPDADEPRRVAESVKQLNLKHCVITSVDRDDLEDGGATHWAQTIREIKKLNPQTSIEVLIPDFSGNTKLLDLILDAGPDVVSHNLETVERLTPKVRSAARYQTSLKVLQYIADKGFTAKSGIMLGLGELQQEVISTLGHMKNAGVLVVTIGQYLRPSLRHLPVESYIEPSVFDEYRTLALNMGFSHVESQPLVRSSYHAEKHISK